MARSKRLSRGETTPLLVTTANDVYRLPRSSWAYPFMGILYLLTHPRLLPPLLSRLIPLLLLSTAVLVILFLFAYLPQVAFLAFFNGPLAWVNAAFMVLSEAAAIITFLAENFMTEEMIVETFDAVMIEEAEKFEIDAGAGGGSGGGGVEREGFKARIYGMIASTRELDQSQSGSLKKLGKHWESPYLRFSCGLTMAFLLELPLNLVPVVGPPLFLILQGYHLGPLCHYRYLQLKHFSKKDKKRFIKVNRWKYWLFGITHVTLQVIPILSIFFLFTSATGAALWAVDAEKRKFLLRSRPPSPFGSGQGGGGGSGGGGGGVRSSQCYGSEGSEGSLGSGSGRRWWGRLWGSGRSRGDGR